MGRERGLVKIGSRRIMGVLKKQKKGIDFLAFPGTRNWGGSAGSKRSRGFEKKANFEPTWKSVRGPQDNSHREEARIRG